MTNRNLLIAGLAVFSVMLTSCMGGGASMFRADAEHSGAKESAGPQVLDSLAWKYQAPDKVYSSPIAYDGEIYIGCNDGFMYAIDNQTGLMKWKFRTEGNVESTPAVVDGVVYIGSWDKHVYAVDTETQRVKWKYRTSGPVSSSPVVVDGMLYVGSEDGHVYAISTDKGYEKWRFKADGPVYSSPAVFGISCSSAH